MNLHFLHGFLGFGADWDIFRPKFYPHECFAYNIEDFFSNGQNMQNSQFKSWAQNFNKHVFANRNLAVLDSAQSSNKRNVLIGYSLGGRLALHSLLEANQWDGVILISTNPGLACSLEKEIRIQNDEEWGLRFINEDWDDVMDAWNSQSVFSGQSSLLKREENAYDRKNIYKIIKEFSLGRQNDLRDFIKHIQKPILWISGELDTKLVNIGKEVSLLNSNIQSIIIPKVGHRVPWELPSQFEKICNDFLQDMYMY